jgi:sugar phosphate isomerase/epimerase
MRIVAAGRPALLTYCTNVHPADDLAQLERALGETTSGVARAVARGAPFGLGLRLGEAQLRELVCDDRAAARFDALLAAHRFFVFTLNGFPQVGFHARRVKEAVYRPDWTEASRGRYTLDLARRLAAWLPADDRFGTISTLPVGWRADVSGRLDLAVREIWRLVAGLARLEAEHGAWIMACLEPEPGCAVETIADLVGFVDVVRRAERPEGLRGARGDALLGRHVGVCYDLCHQAVVFADPEEDVAALREAGIPVGKVQISNGLRLPFADATGLGPLLRCDEERFLHQVVIQDARSGALGRFTDLPDVARAAASGGIGGAGEARCHFHVPIDAESFPPLLTTRSHLERALAAVLRGSDVRHFEVETYTFDVLPDAIRSGGLEALLVREIGFARDLLARG